MAPPRSRSPGSMKTFFFSSFWILAIVPSILPWPTALRSVCPVCSELTLSYGFNHLLQCRFSNLPMSFGFAHPMLRYGMSIRLPHPTPILPSLAWLSGILAWVGLMLTRLVLLLLLILDDSYFWICGWNRRHFILSMISHAARHTAITVERSHDGWEGRNWRRGLWNKIPRKRSKGWDCGRRPGRGQPSGYKVNKVYLKKRQKGTYSQMEL